MRPVTQAAPGGANGADPRVEAVQPLAPIQHGVLFDVLYRPRPGLYVSQLACSFSGSLEVEALRAAWERIVERHGIFRTGFFWEDLPDPLQVVLRRGRLPLEVLDWRELPEAQAEARLRERAARDREEPFDLHRPPLLRLTLVQLTETRWHLIWTYHHLVMDGWSEPLVLGELLRSYAALAHGRQPSLPAAPTFGDYVAWLNGRDLAPGLSFWRERLRGYATPVTLADRPAVRAEAEAPAAEERRFHAGSETSEGLRRLARRHGLTLHTVVAGAWSLLLAAFAERDDVVFGIAVAGRPPELPGVEAIVGPFINTVPLRARLGEEDLPAWLRALQIELAEVRQYEHTPLVEVQSVSGVPGGQALFETLFVFQNLPTDGLAVPSADLGLELEEDRFEGGSTGYPLSLDVVPAGRMALTLTLDPQRVSRERADEVQAAITDLLAALAAQADAPGTGARTSDLLGVVREARRRCAERRRTELEALSVARLRGVGRRGRARRGAGDGTETTRGSGRRAEGEPRGTTASGPGGE